MSDGEPRLVRGILLVLAAVPLVVVGMWIWPPAFREERLGRDVVLAAGGALCFAAATACVLVGGLRALQAVALGRPPVAATLSGHRRIRIRRPTDADGAADARYYLRIDREGRRALGIRVEPDVAASFRVPAAVELWRLGPAASYRRVAPDGGGEVVHASSPCLPFPRETESL